MITKTKKPVAPQQTGNFKQLTQSKDSKQIRVGSKLHSVISHLSEGYRLNRIQAEKLFDHHSLPSMIAEFQIKYGIPVKRSTTTVPGKAKRRPLIVMEYWLTQKDQRKASKLLEVV